MNSQKKNIQPSNETKIYADSKIQVNVGVDANRDLKIDYHRTLNNCIKITAFANDAHFIQFVTRQVPDFFTFEQTHKETLIWDKDPDIHYMQDSIHPRWKLDVPQTSKTCYYDEEGLSYKTERLVSMYDYPGGDMEPRAERCIFCTFVVINSQITHLIQWSKQYDVKQNEFYDVNVRLWNNHSLPYWAIKLIQAHYQPNAALLELKEKNEKDAIQFELRRKIDLPNIISDANLVELKSKSEQEIIEEASLYFMQPHKEWLTLVQYPTLFPQILYSKTLGEVLMAVPFPSTVKDLILEYSHLPRL
jgi:hypothetical protein